ncbi:uncharacterized protein LOC114943278 [Nylanderia fulva]|uniref:uncharacterized protein LOC114943278 n=1 Tax=Nylanderia fulva TaxID=613905 RepID=UPI0010FB57B6|nr:uncharacterized protein LOC114943278 [Nylanderia fulva]
MTAYKDLGHMELVPVQAITRKECYYMPHHAVTKPADPDGKIRVVFNASCSTTTGFVFTTDLVKMFRQIRIHHKDANLQRVLWRTEPSMEVQNFRLKTVTYGTTSAPYLAIRTLLQLAQDEGEMFPLGAKAIRTNTYIDILAGSDTLDQTLELKAQLVQLLASRGFQLSKWASNHNALASEEDQEDRLITEGLSTLGILWSPQEDTIAIRAVPPLTQNTDYTKRLVLSIIARSYDPLGLAAPALVAAKKLLQDLWMAGLEWDQSLSEPLLRQ